ncbi:MAG TPA: Rieske 2Fe-2S domain-containing protein [Marmoricola sp.]|jgi:phenylpropionate dioxygenase-like ring-hydroxylating dioxygenase large terminal subunit|nr:Rieske 2Fe-2S domain-containing protein [Marmoricola sp.]
MRLHGLGLDLTGWFQVGWSADLGPGDVQAMRYFGQDLVAWRDEDGAVHIQGRYCQHLGASLAHGGQVTAAGIRCPFHGWVWDGEGRNVEIPYQDRVNKARKLSCWHVAELNESIYLWHDAAGRAPLWAVPDALASGVHVARCDFYPLTEEARVRFPGLRVHPQMVAENAVDAHHFRFVHGTPASPVVLEERLDGPVWWSRVGFGRGWSESPTGPDGAVRTDSANTIEILWSGLGVSVNTEHTRDGVRVVAVNTTPVEDGVTEMFTTYWVGRGDGDAPADHGRRLAEAKAAVPDDLNIWDHQIYLDPPGLATEEGRAFRRMRRWAHQFYNDHDPS